MLFTSVNFMIIDAYQLLTFIKLVDNSPTLGIEAIFVQA